MKAPTGIEPSGAPARPADRVVLLHGIARTAASLRPMQRALRSAGFHTLNLGYAARRKPLEMLAEDVARAVRGFVEGTRAPVHLVTHSMGGLVARALITRHRPAALGRVVMLGPPNGGSELADFWSGSSAYRLVFGPAGAQLTTGAAARLRPALGPVDYPLGIIAGDRSINLLSSWLVLPGPDDGRVTVVRTAVAGMAEHLTLHATHPFMMRNPAVIRQTIHFLRHGRFAQRCAVDPATGRVRPVRS